MTFILQTSNFRVIFLENLNCTKLPRHGYFYHERGPKYAFLTTYPPNLVYVVFKRLLFKLSLLDVFFFRYYQVFSFLAITANFLFSLLTKLQLVLYSTFLFDHQKVLIVPRSIFRNLLSLDIKICQNASV